MPAPAQEERPDHSPAMERGGIDRCPPPMAGRQDLLLISVGLILAAFVPRLWLLQTRFFDRDELEHLHTAWLTFEGQLPYRDFFQNHTPLLYFFLAPLFMFYDAARNIDDAFALMFTARRLMWLLAGSILALTYCLGRTWRDWRIGLAAAVFLANTIMFLEKTLEIRPDLISVTCWLGALVLLVRGAQAERADASRTRYAFVLIGFLIGSAMMATQKMVFTGPGLAVAMTWYLLDPRSHGGFKGRLTNVLLQVAGASAPILAIVVYFTARGALEEFIYFNWVLNAAWQIRFSPARYLEQLWVQNGLLVGLSVIGVLGIGLRMFSREAFRRGDYIVVINGIGLFAGLFIISVPHRQYYLMFLPLIAIYAATAMVDLVDFLAARWQGKRLQNGRLFLLVNGVLFLMIAAITVWSLPAKPKSPMGLRFTVLIGALGSAWALSHFVYGFRNTALGILLILSSVYPLRQLHAMFYARSNEPEIQGIRYVLKNTSLAETVMDGQGGVGVFRRHAYFYWLLDPNIRRILTADEKNKLLTALQTGAVAPKVINLDHALQDLSPEITKFFEENYEPANVGLIRIRKANNSP
jgi:4-amino-4-deoxy-L-arabinose transferase-like glycosyltransferase